MPNDYAFEMAGSAVRFGPGVTREIGMDLADMGIGRVMVLTDPTVVKLQPVATVLESLEHARVAFALFDRVHVEPTDGSFREAIRFASEGRFDGFVAVGGGSTIDTAKAANLYSTYPPEDFLDYVNAPVGKGAVSGEDPVPSATSFGSRRSGCDWAARGTAVARTKRASSCRMLIRTCPVLRLVWEHFAIAPYVLKLVCVR